MKSKPSHANHTSPKSHIWSGTKWQKKNASKAKNKSGIKIKNYQMITHLNMGTKHLSKHSGTFVCEGLPLHGKSFIQESSIRVFNAMAGKYGKSETVFYLNEKDSPIFDTIEKMVEHYHKTK